MKMLETRSVYYDDVNLIAQPQHSIISRKEVPEEKDRIFISPMSFLIGETFAKKCLDAGYSVCLHRFYQNEFEQLYLYNKLVNDFNRHRLWITVGKNTSLNFIESCVNAGCENILLDIASGYLTSIVDRFFNDVRFYNFIRIGIGNIHSSNILKYYIERFIELAFWPKELYVRCGISSGGCCSTKDNTGYNRGQITEISECVSYFNTNFKHLKPFIKVLADGGISNPGCAAKAFGAGADCIMLASYWKDCEDAETHLIGEHKAYGGASKAQLNKLGVDNKHSEGKEFNLNKESLISFEEKDIQLWGGISSAVSYSGYDSLSSFINNGVFELKI